ncbi:MAG: transaldolase family protein [Planctomycetota bacterium]|jgi:transaldolase
MIGTDTIAEAAHEIACRGFKHEFGTAAVQVKEQPLWDNIRRLGTRLWLDTGDMDLSARLWCSQFEALTTNNTLLNKEIQKGIYDRLIAEAASVLKVVAPDIEEEELILEVAFILNAHHGLKLVELFDAHVSVELHTDLGDDVERSVAYGKRYYRICPERFYVKVPLTPAGFLAARELCQAGVPVNFTLGFSARQAYAAALLAQPRFVNVFMGRLNAFVSDNELGDGINIGEKTTLAAQRQVLELREAARTESRLIGASMRDSSQVAALGGLDVYTMPPKVADEYLLNPADQIVEQVGNDPSVSFVDGVAPADFNAPTLWEVPDDFKQCVGELARENIGRMTAGDVREYFADHGFADFLPRWSEDDIRTVLADGKIPVYSKWKDLLAGGEIGMDALMNISAFYSFASDQEALDARIESLI